MVKGKKYPCRICVKNISKCSKAVHCKPGCLEWFHVKCIGITSDEYRSIANSETTWNCNECRGEKVNAIDNETRSAVDVLDIEEEIKNTTLITTEINHDLALQVENLSMIINTQQGDLQEAYKEISELKIHKTNLESMVLKKEEEILVLKGKVSELEESLHKMNTKNKSINESFAYTGIRRQHNLSSLSSLPQSTPVQSMIRNGLQTNEEKEKGRNSRVLYSDSLKKQKKTFSGPVLKKAEDSFISTNRFAPLAVDNTDDKEEIQENNRVKELPKKALQKTKNKEVKKKITICADSHGHNLAYTINAIQERYEAVGFVRPGACSDDVLNSGNIKKEHFKEEEVCVIIVGTNDVSKNEGAEAIKNIKITLDNLNETKFVVVGLPSRYDLVEWSCVNEEVKKTNEALSKICEERKTVAFIDVSGLPRDLHTKHGLHLNYRGKQWLAGKVCFAVDTLTELVEERTQENNNSISAEGHSSNLGNDKRQEKQKPH